MELIVPQKVHPAWENPYYPTSGWIIGRSDGYLWLSVQMGFNWRLIGTADDEYSGCYDFGWCYPGERPLVLSVSLWEPDTQDEPLGWHKRATPKPRRAPRRSEDPDYNRARCVHGTYTDGPHCKIAEVCDGFPGVLGPRRK